MKRSCLTLLLLACSYIVSAQVNPANPQKAEADKIVSYFYVTNMTDSLVGIELQKFLLEYTGKIIEVQVYASKKIIQITHYSFFPPKEIVEILGMTRFKCFLFQETPDLNKNYEFNSQGKYKEF